MEIISHAAFPYSYYIEPLDFTIMKESKDFMIHSVTIKDGQCVKVRVAGHSPREEMHIYKLKDDIKIEIFPKIIRE